MNRPSGEGRVESVVGTTTMIAVICGWMLQNTRYVPGDMNVRWRDSPARYSPRSNGCGPESENTLWKMLSLLGKSMVEPVGTASTCGWNVLFFCASVARRGDRGAAASSGS